MASVFKVQPTRMELIKLKRRIKMAKRGYELLKMKRDSLITEFRNLLEDAKRIMGSMAEKYEKAMQKLALAIAVDGIVTVRSIALSRQCEPTFVMHRKNIMGVVIPNIKSDYSDKHFLNRGYGSIGTSASIDEAAFNFEHVVQKVIEAAEVETALKKLLIELPQQVLNLLK